MYACIICESHLAVFDISISLISITVPLNIIKVYASHIIARFTIQASVGDVLQMDSSREYSEPIHTFEKIIKDHKIPFMKDLETISMQEDIAQIAQIF